MPELRHQSLCPIQCRVSGVIINECPGMYCVDHSRKSHAIVAYDDNGDKVILRFFLKEVTSKLEVLSLDVEEFAMHGCPRIERTSSQLTWDPSFTVSEDQENVTLSYTAEIVRPGIHKRRSLMVINSMTMPTCADAVDVLSDDNFHEALEANVNVS